jgi:hypothetical protein
VNLQDFKKQYPKYGDVPDDALADALFEKYYSGKMARDDFRAQVGLSRMREEEAAQMADFAGPDTPEMSPGEASQMADFAAPESIDPNEPARSRPLIRVDPGRMDPSIGLIAEIRNRRAAASARGVDVETGAPSGARARGSFGGDERNVEEGIKIGLAKSYGKPVQLRKSEQGLEFMNPETDQWTLVNPPGLDWNDFASLAGEAVSIGPEIAGGVAGSFTGSPGAGSVAGGAVGAFVGELTRLRVGQRMGVNADMSDDDVITSAAVNAGIAVAGGTVALGLMKAGKVILSGLPAPIARSVGDRLEEGIAGTKPLREEVKRQTGRDLNLTTGQTLRDEPIAGAERSIAGSEAGSGIRKTYREQQETVDALKKRISEPFEVEGSPETLAERAGRGVQEAVGVEPRATLATAEAETEAARRQARATFSRASDNALPPQEAGILAREKLATGRESVQRAFRARYTEIDDLAEGKTVPLTGLRTTGQKWAKVLNDDIIPSLAAEDAPIIKEAATAGTKEVSGTVVERPASFSAVQRTLSTLRDEIRAAKKGFTKKNAVALQDLHDALLKDRDAALAGSPELRQAIASVDADYRAAKQAIDRSLIGEIVKKAEGGGYALRDDQIVNRILQNPSGAKAIASVVNDPQYAAFAEAREPIRKGLLGKWAEAVTSPETGEVSPVANANFLRKNRATLEQFFSPAEIDRLKIPGEAARKLKMMETREANVVADINKSFGMKLDGFDSAEVVDKTWQSSRIGDVRRIKRIAGEKSPQWQSYRAAAMQKLWNETSTWDDVAGAYRVTAADLSKRLEGRETALLRETFGDEFVGNLRILRDTIRAVEPAAGPGGELAAKIGGRGQASALRHFARVYTGNFTPTGRVLTGVIKIRGKAAERKLVDALSDPERLAELIKLRTMKPNDKRAAAILGGAGALILTEDE